jgi:NAD(P)-dependent dehydrogenase (short-subunit alcohol dehydrogenase family)
MKNVLIFGSCGSIGSYIFDKFNNDKYIVIGTTTNNTKAKNNILYVTNDDMTQLDNINNIDIIIWSHGTNINDNISNFNNEIFKNIIDINVTFILNTLNYLLIRNKINLGAKMVIISSIYEFCTRENKLSYSMSKASLRALVKNISFDLSSKNILINNVLPGVIDNEMTYKTLLPENLEYIKNYMNFDRLITLDDVFRTVYFLVTENNGITGQSICVDLGFTNIIKFK